MTELGCSVKNCVHNDDEKCCCHDIDVDGKRAKDSAGTCCGSYSENENCARNSCCSPNNSIEIRCSAENCMYNEDQKCFAEHVDVTHSGQGPDGKTKCATFTVK